MQPFQKSDTFRPVGFFMYANAFHADRGKSFIVKG